MAGDKEITAAFRRRRREAGERPVEMWLDLEMIKDIDRLKSEMQLSSRDAVVSRIIRSHLSARAGATAEVAEVSGR